MPELSNIQVLEYLNNSSVSPQTKIIRKWQDVYYETSLHTKGCRPRYKDLENGEWIHPPRYMGEEYQRLFEKFLLTRHPRENEVTRQWRFSQYRPFTKAAFGMLTDILKGAIFQDSQYTLVLPVKTDHNFIWDNNFNGKSLLQFFCDMVLPAMVEDPNGYIIRMPAKPFHEQTGPRLEVDVFFVNSKEILYSGKRDFIFKRDNYAYWINDLTIFRYYKDRDDKFVGEARGYYAHMLGYLPVSIAGGIWNTEGYFDSFYDKAVPAANEFISSYSAEQLVDKEASHPFIVQVAEDCPECQGVKEVTLTDHQTGQPRKVTCPKCAGKGIISISPADRLQIPLDDWEKGKGDFIRIVNPDVNINRYHREKNAQVMEMILRALNLLNIDAAQSGTAKAIDQEKLYTFISSVSNNLFDNLIFPTVRDIIAFRNVKATPTGTVPFTYDFVLIKPTQFQIKTASDLLLELTESTKGNIPGFIRKKQVVEFVDKRFSGDDVFQRKTELIAELDDLYVYTPDERLTMRTSGEVDIKDLLYSRKLPSILDEILRTKGISWFKSAKIDEVKLLVENLMKPILQVRDFVLNDENGSPADEET